MFTTHSYNEDNREERHFGFLFGLTVFKINNFENQYL